MAIHIALSLSLFGSLALALTLWRWAERVAGTRLLTAYLVGISVWIAGNELPTWFGRECQKPGAQLAALVRHQPS